MSAATGGDTPLPPIRPTLRPSKASQKAQAKPRAASPGPTPQPAQMPPDEPDEKPRRRSRPNKEAVGNAAKRLAGWHAILASMMKMPELMITEAEAEQLVIAGADVSEEFDIEIGGKFAAIFGLVGTAAAVYFPRILMFVARPQAEQSRRGPGVVDGDPLTDGPQA